MSKTQVPHRMPSASSVARPIRDAALKISAFVLIVILAFPSLLGFKSKSHAKSIETKPAPASARPEPFVVQETSGVAGAFLTSVMSRTFSAVDSLRTPAIPGGFESAKVPTLVDRLSSAITAGHRGSVTPPVPAPVPATVLFDFDDDGKADIGRWQGSNTEFKVRNSNGGSYTATTIGSSSSVAVPGDFDGDGKTDPAVFDAGSWVIKKSSNGSTQNITFGTSGDKPVSADYDGDGTTDAAVFRPSTNVWWIRKSSDASTISSSFGSTGDIPVTGNWDGDAYADIAVYRPSTGYW